MAQVEEFSRVADQFPTIDERKNTKFLFQITDPYLLYYRGGLEILVQVPWLKLKKSAAVFLLWQTNELQAMVRCSSNQFLLQPHPESFQQVWHLRFVKYRHEVNWSFRPKDESEDF